MRLATRAILSGLLALLWLLPVSGPAAQDDISLESLQREVEALKHEYQRRLTELEQRLDAAEKAAGPVSENPAPTAAGASPPASGSDPFPSSYPAGAAEQPSGGESGMPAPPVATGSATRAITDKSFNPALSFILDGRFAYYSEDEEERPVPGFQLGGHGAELPGEGFSLNESELTLSANIDDKFYGQSTLAVEQAGAGTEVGLEEAYLETLALPHGFTLKAGRFFSDIGYLNKFHTHANDFDDEPLVYRMLLGNRLIETGAQASWIAPTDFYLLFGGEVFRGEGFPAAGAANDGMGLWDVFVKAGGDVGIGHSWQAGLSYLHADVAGRSGGGHGHAEEPGEPEALFSGDSKLAIFDFVWKWAPLGNPRQRNFKFQSEYFWRREDGSLELQHEDVLETGRYKGSQEGFYAQAIYQFLPRWRFGLRYGRLQADNTVLGLDEPVGLAQSGFTPERYSAMLDFSNSEFSRIRLQYNRDESSPIEDNQLILQYVMSIGAHSAHEF